MIRLGLDEARWSSTPAAEARDLTTEQFQSLGLIGPVVNSGVVVNHQSALGVSAHWCAIARVAVDISVIDRNLYRHIGDGGDPEQDREVASDHPIDHLVFEEPNPNTTAKVFWETFIAHVRGWGNGCAEIERDNAGRPLALHLITPDQLEPKIDIVIDKRGRMSSKKWFLYRGTTRLEDDEVLHLPGLGYDGVRGYSPVYLARHSLGLSMAMERFGEAFFGEGAWPGIALEHPKNLSPDAQERIREAMNRMHRGPEKSHRMIILEEGMKLSKPITIPPDEAQFLQSREFQIEEIARWHQMPPHKLGAKTGERPGGNIEAQELDYTITTLLPLTTALEQEMKKKLLMPGERDRYYFGHNFAKRLILDSATRMAAYKTLHDMGAITAAEVARRENLPKPPAVEKPAPSAPAGAPAPPPVPAAPAAPPDRALPPVRLHGPKRDLLASLLARFMRREAEQAKRASAKGPAALEAWVEAFYESREEEAILTDSLEPAVALCMAIANGATVDRDALGAARAARAFAAGYFARSRSELLSVKANEVRTAVPAMLTRWAATRVLEGVEDLLRACDPTEERNVA